VIYQTPNTLTIGRLITQAATTMRAIRGMIMAVVLLVVYFDGFIICQQQLSVQLNVLIDW